MLLSASRRAQYGVTSPVELSATLESLPPQAVLTGFEATNPGFEAGQPGGLETPLTNYARSNAFDSVQLPAPFLEQTITLWFKQP